MRAVLFEPINVHLVQAQPCPRSRWGTSWRASPTSAAARSSPTSGFSLPPTALMDSPPSSMRSWQVQHTSYFSFYTQAVGDKYEVMAGTTYLVFVILHPSRGWQIWGHGRYNIPHICHFTPKPWVTNIRSWQIQQAFLGMSETRPFFCDNLWRCESFYPYISYGLNQKGDLSDFSPKANTTFTCPTCTRRWDEWGRTSSTQTIPGVTRLNFYFFTFAFTFYFFAPTIFYVSCVGKNNNISRSLTSALFGWIALWGSLNISRLLLLFNLQRCDILSLFSANKSLWWTIPTWGSSLRGNWVGSL